MHDLNNSHIELVVTCLNNNNNSCNLLSPYEDIKKKLKNSLASNIELKTDNNNFLSRLIK